MRTSSALLILGALILASVAKNTAHPREKRAISEQANAAVEKGMAFASAVVEKLKNSEVGRKLIGKVVGGMGDLRGKRSIQIDAALTNYNTAQYQKLEVHKTLTNDAASKNKISTCPIAQNELNFIETISIAVQHALGEVNKVINGQKVAFQVPKPTSVAA
ncbi:uncharacterized protein LOC126559287 [Anopheles maculipalpis]|uniref:uncharacterized protein LOC126559287 n=1 Tax=Anopheles maculipalpis TaxID=1496333 RepID=UPI0021595EED|nr:uncharacterized protein LOC126559287 [Anopheles maculipalpis]